MAFLGGIKDKFQTNEFAGNMANRLSSAKEYLAEKKQTVSEMGPLKAVTERVGNLVPQGVGNYFSPSTWSKYFPAGGGKRQSPIDILTSEAKFDESLGDGGFKVNWSPADCLTLRNTGFSFQIDCQEIAQSTMTAIHLNNEMYRMRQIHGHWSTEPMNGSEHLVGGVGYAGELHIVNWNAKYPSFEEALKQPDGVAVLGVFLNESHDDNPNLEPIIQFADRIMYKGDQVPLNYGFDVSRLLPDKLEYWTYEGSLTTPPLNECVIWTVFRASIPISSIQLDKLRQMYAVGIEDVERNPQKIAGNVRPPQGTNGRLIRASFRSGGVVEQPPAQ